MSSWVGVEVMLLVVGSIVSSWVGVKVKWLVVESIVISWVGVEVIGWWWGRLLARSGRGSYMAGGWVDCEFLGER